MSHNFELAYKSPEEFMREVLPDSLRSGDRVSVRLSDNTKYFFTYLTTIGGDIQGRSALNGRKISINAVDMILTEHDTTI